MHSFGKLRVFTDVPLVKVLCPSASCPSASSYRYRSETETWKTDGTTDRTFDYAYDTSDRLVSIDDSDSLATDFEFAYDDRSQRVAESQLIGLVGTAVNFTREFDKRGNRLELAANFGGTLSGATISGGVDDFENVYEYDYLNRLSSLIQQSQSGGHAVAPKLAEFEYNRASQLIDLHRYSAAAASTSDLQVHTRMAYDDAGRLSSLTHGASQIASGQNWNGTSTLPASLGSSGLLAAYTFDYDADNRLTQFSTYRDGTSTAYGYDVRDQLTSAASTAISGLSQPFGLATAESYDFDASGNRKSSGGASQSAANTHNQLQSDGTHTYTYDDEGRVTSPVEISVRLSVLSLVAKHFAQVGMARRRHESQWFCSRRSPVIANLPGDGSAVTTAAQRTQRFATSDGVSA